MGSIINFAAEVEKRLGKGVLTRLSEQPPIRRIPTGITQLDCDLGGGWAVGKINTIWGAKSAGKTTLALRAIAQAQKLCRYDAMPMGDPSVEGISQYPVAPQFFDDKGKAVKPEAAVKTEKKVDAEMRVVDEAMLKPGYTMRPGQAPMRTLFANVEQTLDLRWARQLGVNPDDVWEVNADSAEAYLDTVDAAIRENVADLIIVDSLAFLAPQKETEESTQSWQQGLQARLLGKAMRMWVASLATYKDAPVRPTLLLINQVREKIGVMYGSPEVKPGGHAPTFATAIEVKVWAGPINKQQDLAPEAEGGNQLVQRTNYKVTWNKTFPRGSVGQYVTTIAPFGDYAAGEIVQQKQLIDLFKHYGALVQDGGKWVLIDREFKTQKAIFEWAAAEPALFEKYRQKVVEIVCKTRAGWV